MAYQHLKYTAKSYAHTRQGCSTHWLQAKCFQIIFQFFLHYDPCSTDEEMFLTLHWSRCIRCHAFFKLDGISEAVSSTETNTQ